MAWTCSYFNGNGKVLEWKCLNFHWYFTEVYSQASNWQYISIGSDNGLALARQQAIIWTNDGRLLMHICITQPQWVKPEYPGIHISILTKHIWISILQYCFSSGTVCILASIAPWRTPPIDSLLGESLSYSGVSWPWSNKYDPISCRFYIIYKKYGHIFACFIIVEHWNGWHPSS